MGIIDKIRRLFKRKDKEEQSTKEIERFKALDQALPSASKRLQALDRTSSSASERFRALQSASSAMESAEEKQERTTFELQRDSLQLGLTAGLVGKTIKDIENTLYRIESQMVTKEWFTLQFRDLLEVIQRLKEHEEKEQERFQILLEAITSLKRLSTSLPTDLRKNLMEQVEKIESTLPLTPRMKQILEIVKQKTEISYEELSKILGISLSGLRGVLTEMRKRTDEIECFIKDGHGWIKYRAGALPSASERSSPFDRTSSSASERLEQSSENVSDGETSG